MNYGKALNQYHYLRSFGASWDTSYMDGVLKQYWEIDLPKVLDKLPQNFSDHFLASDHYHGWYLKAVDLSGDMKQLTFTLFDTPVSKSTEAEKVELTFLKVYPLHIHCDEDNTLLCSGKEKENEIFGMTLEESAKQRNRFSCHILLLNGASIAFDFGKVVWKEISIQQIK